ncbi:MAG: TIR domain-containing protein [Rhodocyclaceae bacterium]|nr:TIR domain-containing protein [Rhodocyclaceae bacterium]
MSAIFISHSSADNAAAASCAARLKGQGHHSVFLDFDPALGIPAGRNWERELYARLRACQAVVLLCSPHSLASPWCFAEITQARALGKPVFPLGLAAGALPPLLHDVQAIDLTRDAEDGWQRLWRGLKLAGLDPANLFERDPARPPYPGFTAMQEQDAAVFFGRDAAVHEALERLNRLRNLGGARLLLVLGASGSGKSSLVRAGVLPRLKRDAARWLPIAPMRPMLRPQDECARAFAATLRAAGDARDWKALRDALQVAGKGGAVTALMDLAYDLRMAAAQPDATPLLVVDQFEELLGAKAGAAAQSFCAVFTRLLAEPDCPYIAVATLRSDFLEALQNQPDLQGLNYEALHLAPMPLADFAQVIEGPAAVAGVDLETGLAQAMVADAATENALPLLAFALRELWDRYGGDGRLTLSEYRDQLGGLKAAVGRVAEEIFAAAGAPCEADMRRAFLSMLRVDDEGRYVRKPARLADLPAAVHALVERYVQARLLVARGDGQARLIEVAHDALFRSWDRLAAWLSLDREFLLWRTRLQFSQADWVRTGHNAAGLLRGALLAEALRWLDSHAADIDTAGTAYIGASRQHAEQEARRWEQLYNKALSRQLAAQALAAADPRLGLLLCRAALQRAATQAARRNMLDLLYRTRYLRCSLYAHDGAVSCVAFSAPGGVLATGGQDGQVLLWDMGSTPPARVATLSLGHPLSCLEFSADGTSLAAGGELPAAEDSGGFVWMWDVATRTPRSPSPQALPAHVSAVRFSPDASVLAAACWDGSVYFCDPHDAGGAAPAYRGEGSVNALAFSADGATVASLSSALNILGSMRWQNKICVWERASGQLLRDPLDAHEGGATCLAYSADGGVLVTGGNDSKLVLWNAAELSALSEGTHDALGAHGISCLALAADGGAIATGSADGSVILWNLQTGSREFLLAHQQAVMQLAFAPDGQTLASCGVDGSVAVWNRQPTVPAGEALRIHEDAVVGLGFDPSGSVLAAACANAAVALWPYRIGAPLYRSPEHAGSGRQWCVAFSADLQLAAAADFGDKLIRLWHPPSGEARADPIPFEAMIPALAFNADASLLAYVSGQSLPTEGNSHIVLWDVARGLARARLACEPYGLAVCLAFSPQGDRLAAGTWGGEVLLWDVASGARSDTALYTHGESVLSVAFNHDGSLLASGSGAWFGQGRNTLALWDLAAANFRQAPFTAHGNGVTTLAFSPDGSLLASASGSLHSNAGGADLRLWDAATGMALSVPIAAHPDMVRCLCFAPGTQLLVSAGNDGSLRFWRLDADEWLQAAAERAGRELAADELALYMPDEAAAAPD